MRGLLKMECFCVMSEEIEGRLSPAYYKIKNPFLKNKYELIDIEDYFIVNPKFQNKENLKEISFLPMKNINPDLQQVDKFDTIEIEKIKGYTPFEEGDLVFAKVTPCMENGNIAICEKMPFKIGVGTSEIFVFREKQKNKITNRFLKYLFSLTDFRQFAKNNFTGTGGLQRVPRDFFNNLKIPLPSLDIQNKIVSLMDNAYKEQKNKEKKVSEFLDSINDYVLDELEIELPELKDKMTYVVSSEEVKNKRCDAYYFQPKFEEVEKAVNKGKFEVKSLKEFITKIHYGASVKNEYVDEGIPLLRILNLKPNKFELKSVVKLPEYMKKDLGNAFVNEDDLLISRSGTVGIVSVVPREADGFAFGSFMIKFCLNEKINKHYVSAWLNTKLQKLFIEREKIGAIQGNITIGTIEDFKIPLPPLSVQNKIAAEVKMRMQRADSLQKEAKAELEQAKAEVEQIILG